MNNATLVISGETNSTERALGEAQGATYKSALQYMVSDEAAQGEKQSHDDLIIAYAVEEAEGMYMPEQDTFMWSEPEQENAHIEIAVADRYTGRFLPGCDVMVSVIHEDGTVLGTELHEFLWHPWLHHYGRNWHIPEAGLYSLHVEITPPRIARHDKKNGNFFTHPVTALFKEVSLPIGKKIT